MKLLKKDVLKWIKALKSGRYKKGKSRLVSKDGTEFCCLGVWADMHGCTWAEDTFGNLIPVPKGRVNMTFKQGNSTSYLKDPLLARGLVFEDFYLESTTLQSKLAALNDRSRTFKPVIKYIEKEILPLAK